VARLELRVRPPAAAAPNHAPAAKWKPGQPVPPGYHWGKFGLVKLAPPGARYPSRRPPEVRDDLIERIDRYSARIARKEHG
jgi:hypothetical protein